MLSVDSRRSQFQSFTSHVRRKHSVGREFQRIPDKIWKSSNTRPHSLQEQQLTSFLKDQKPQPVNTFSCINAYIIQFLMKLKSAILKEVSAPSGPLNIFAKPKFTRSPLPKTEKVVIPLTIHASQLALTIHASQPGLTFTSHCIILLSNQ